MDATKKRKMDENGAVLSADATTPTATATASAIESLPKLTPDDARKLLEPFTHDQLLSVLQTALLRHPDVLDSVRSVADRDLSLRKLFVRGLGWDTTTDNLRALFSSFGELEEAAVIFDKLTHKSKGYAFVTFKHVDGALLALKEPSKKIDGRVTVTQLANQGGSGGGPNVSNSANLQADVSMRKIYVANVPFEMSAERLLGVFASYGEIEEGPLGFDKQTGKSRGFALFVYKTAEAAQAALIEPTKLIDGRQLLCKLAIEGKKNKGGAGPGGGVQGPSVDGTGDGLGLAPPAGAGQYGGPGGISSYGGFSAGPPPLGHHGLNSSLPSGLSSVGGQGPGSYGGPYGGSHYGGPGSGGYGAMGGASGGLGGGLGGAGGAGGASSLYGRLPPSSVGMPSGGYPEGGHYSLSSSGGYPSQHHQPAGTSPVPRVPPGGMYPGVPPYY